MARIIDNYWLRQCVVLLLTLAAYIFLPLGLLLVPVYFLRFFVAGLGQTFRKDFGKMLTPRSTLFAAEYKEMFKSRTRCAVYVWFVIDIDKDLDKIYKFCYENVIMRKKEGSEELQNPELQQTITSWLGYLFWRWDRNFAMENHVHMYNGPGKVNGVREEDLAEIVRELASRPFVPGRSPWDMWVWDNAEMDQDLGKGKKKRLFFLRMHHALGDGFSIMRLLVEDVHGTEMPVKNFQPPTKENDMSTWKICKILMKAPYEMIETGVHSWDFNGWRLPEKKMTGKLNVGLTNLVPVERVKEIKRAYGTSFTAVILAAFAGGIRNFMVKTNMRVPEKIHCVVPLPMPGHSDKLRNHITAVITPLPVGLADPRKRLENSEKMLQDVKKSSVPIATFLCLPLLGGLPLFVIQILARNLVTTALMSIIPGPAFPGKLMGHEAHRIMFGGGLLVGNIGLGLSALSYNGYLRFGVGLDQGIYEDREQAEQLSRFIEAELDALRLEHCV